MPTRRELLTRSLTTLAAAAAPACMRSVGAAQASSTGVAAARGATLAAYRSEEEFAAALARWRTDAEKWVASQRPRRADGGVVAMQSMPAPAAPASALAAEKSSASAEESITNVQTAGVDEGGIVKRIGDFLLILRRGRLFTVRVGGDSLRPVAMLDAYAPGSDPRGAWYDELLVSGSTVVVIGYSYARGGTEIGLFDLSADGGLKYRATYHLRSYDYYSSRNYASRLIGRKLIFYTPTLLRPWGPAPRSPFSPMASSPRSACSRRPGMLSRIQAILVAEKYGSSMSPVRWRMSGSAPSFFNRAHWSAVRRSCQTMAL